MGPLVGAEALNKFKGRRVFVTGHTGFKGSWLAFLLTELGADVAGYALPPLGKQSHFEKLSLSDRLKHVEGDICDIDSLRSAMERHQPEYVFHLAAQALVKSSYSDPIETYRTNVMGSVNVLEVVRFLSSVRSLIYVTSDKCYENQEWIWGYREEDQLGGHDPYSSSKAAAELVFSCYWRSFLSVKPEFGAATVRAGNVIGGGDWAADRIVPDCIRAIESGKPIELRNPTATRPWQHVLEPISGYMQLAANLFDTPDQYSGAWNFGPSSSQCRTVGNVAETIVKHLGSGEISVPDNVVHQYEAQLLQLNCDKAHQLLNWRSRWDVEETLSETAHWYKAVNAGEAVVGVTRRQLQDYFPEISQLSEKK